jgi:two-component system NtrC family sensor kinase
MGSEPGIRRIRVFNPRGKVAFQVDNPAAAPLSGSEHMLPLTRPIANAPECSNASCHVHDASERVLGVIDAQLSLATVDAQIARNQTALAWFLLAALLFGSALGTVFIWLTVYRPVKELIDGTHRVAGGDLTYRLPVRGDDELGDLARAFNRMTGEVAGVQAEIEERVRRKTAELERVHRSLLGTEKMASIGKLAATVAHEINNPLFGILTYARLVARELAKHEFATRDDLVEQMQTIERESKRCGDLVRNLLTFSRQAPSHREPNDFNTVVERAAVLVKHKLEMQGIELKESLTAGLPPVECDANQIQQVVLVLMVNASEAMPHGGAIEVATEFDPGTDQETVIVKDNGSGIPPDVLPRIFDPFFTTKEEQLRTGLGLAVAKSIVEQHGGEITVRSMAGEGTEFRVTLPVAVAAAGVERH